MPNIKEIIAEILKQKPNMRRQFEQAYEQASLEEGDLFSSPIESSIKHRDIQQIPVQHTQSPKRIRPKWLQEKEEKRVDIIHRIVEELVASTEVMHVKDGNITIERYGNLSDREPFVTQKDIMLFSRKNAPQLTGTLMHVDLNNTEDSTQILLNYYKNYLQEQDPEKKKTAYEQFRRGIDMLDITPFIYTVLNRNRISMSYWLPEITKAVTKYGFFKIPETRIAKVPIPVLQMTRLSYESLTNATKDIINQWAFIVFALDINRDYFIKTGTFSSKFFFRNAHVCGAQEVRELGEYLTYIQHQATEMAGYFVQPSFYGVSTTNEWVVREFIQDKENNPTIYHGLPLHTEYRIFVDFDTDEILGISPYWEPTVMKERFSKGSDTNSVHKKHDYVVFLSHEDVLMARYEENKQAVLNHIQEFLPDINLEGQWSIDIMQNGENFYLIDMATADRSALVECVPQGKIKAAQEDWVPAALLTDVIMRSDTK